MKVKVISVLEDNYMYLVIEESTREAVAVDAAVPKRLLEIVRKEDVVLRAILTTHHHWDHARGNEELAQLLPGLRVFGADERIGALTHKFGAIRVRCLFTPCHTSGHMCYFMWEDDSPDAPALFSGDTLFVGGCGQFFEGTAEQMHTNLTQILGTLPKDTKVFCGHECTVRNLKFALKVEPENEVVKEKLAWARGGACAEVHGQDRACGGAEGAALPEGQLQEAQGETQPPGRAGLRLGALRTLPGEEVTSDPPWCQGSLLALPSSDSAPAGSWILSLTCLCEAALLCSPSDSWGSLGSSTWSPLGTPGLGDTPGCWQRVRTWLGAVWGQCRSCPWDGCPWMSLWLGKGAREKWDAQGSGAVPHGVTNARACVMGPLGALLALLSCSSHPGPSQAGDGHLDPHRKLGRHWWHWYQQCPPSSSPVLTNLSSQQGLGGVSPLFPVFPVGPTGICVGICDPGVSRWSPGSAPGGISQGETDFRTKCCQASLAFCLSQDKNWKILGANSMDIALSSRAREQLGLPGLPSLHFLQNQGCVLFIFKSKKGAEFYLQVWGSTLHQ
ncbi:uncharacterized protein LOC130259031 isoform X2 [Oenanthe melanoleuca]|uniref:uncharacterized protein LOC130259031 isoform X2 n=1 Tax=Oenanthe melanoleuca TaxID=2939378 RepID=UPI0024C207D5|nr:uncharacterized protein LOC130259031 isoform X2 [Oenanthe melanoleuca]